MSVACEQSWESSRSFPFCEMTRECGRGLMFLKQKPLQEVIHFLGRSQNLDAGGSMPVKG